MMIIIKKNSCLFIFLLINIVPFLCGNKEPLEGDVKVIVTDKHGSSEIFGPIRDPQVEYLRDITKENLDSLVNKMEYFGFPEHTRDNCREEFEREIEKSKNSGEEPSKYIVISPGKFSNEWRIWTLVKNIINNQMVVKTLVQGVPPEIIRCLPRYKLLNGRERKAEKNFKLAKKEKEECLQVLKQREKELGQSLGFKRELMLLQKSPVKLK